MRQVLRPIYLATLLGVACLNNLPADAKTLRYSTIVSYQHTGVQDAILPFFEHLKKTTGGALTGSVLASGQLLGSRQTLKGIGDGAADAALIIPQYHPNEIPTILILGDMLTYGNDPLAVAGALNEFMLLDCKSCLKEYADNNVFPLANYASTEYRLQCNRPIKTRQDLSGLKVRAVGIMASFLAELGANVVNLTSPEAVEALDRRQIDCTTGPYAWHKSYGLRGSVTNITDASLGVSRGFGLFVINQDVWKGLADGQRKAMVEGAPKLVAGIMFGQVAEDESERKYAMENGVKIIQPDSELANALGSIPNASEILAARAKKLGVDNIEELISAFEKKYAKWEKIMADIGRNNREAYEEALRREVFSKL